MEKLKELNQEAEETNKLLLLKMINDNLIKNQDKLDDLTGDK